MPSSKAILRDITELGLNPAVSHTVIQRGGRLAKEVENAELHLDHNIQPDVETETELKLSDVKVETKSEEVVPVESLTQVEQVVEVKNKPEVKSQPEPAKTTVEKKQAKKVADAKLAESLVEENKPTS